MERDGFDQKNLGFPKFALPNDSVCSSKINDITGSLIISRLPVVFPIPLTLGNRENTLSEMQIPFNALNRWFLFSRPDDFFIVYIFESFSDKGYMVHNIINLKNLGVNCSRFKW